MELCFLFFLCPMILSMGYVCGAPTELVVFLFFFFFYLDAKEAKHQDFIKNPTLTKHSKKIFSTSPLLPINSFLFYIPLAPFKGGIPKVSLNPSGFKGGIFCS